ncbi:MAG TPA: phosphatase PAP2 family protein [Noviherbaspirillum sp.]|nr:phosphatase PAP2 family protein [Noviherbaspirillum sp.]
MKRLLHLLHRHRDIAIALVLAPLILLLFDATPLDGLLIAPYYDAATHAFPLRDDPFIQNVMHSGTKLVVIGIAIAVFGAFLLTFILPHWAQHRRRLLWLGAGLAGSSLMVTLLKQCSALHCPWDLAAYGGYAPFHGLLDRFPAGTAAGRCFPGGHASGGFALMAFYFAWRDTHRGIACVFLVAGLMAGMVMGWAQMMRGAHFLSHNVWSAWVVWTFLSVQYTVSPPLAATPRIDARS